MTLTGGKKKTKKSKPASKSTGKSRKPKSKSSKRKPAAKKPGLKLFDDYDAALSMLGGPFGVTNPFMNLPVPYHNPFTMGKPGFSVDLEIDTDKLGSTRSNSFIDLQRRKFMESRVPSVGLSFGNPSSATTTSTEFAPTGSIGGKKKKSKKSKSKKPATKKPKKKTAHKKPVGGIKRKPAKKSSNSVY